MIISPTRFRRHKSNFAKKQFCDNCSHMSIFQLWVKKTGIGFGVPLINLFTDRFSVTTGKRYALKCTACNQLKGIVSTEAEEFITNNNPASN